MQIRRGTPTEQCSPWQMRAYRADSSGATTAGPWQAWSPRKSEEPRTRMATSAIIIMGKHLWRLKTDDDIDVCLPLSVRPFCSFFWGYIYISLFFPSLGIESLFSNYSAKVSLLTLKYYPRILTKKESQKERKSIITSCIVNRNVNTSTIMSWRHLSHTNKDIVTLCQNSVHSKRTSTITHHDRNTSTNLNCSKEKTYGNTPNSLNVNRESILRKKYPEVAPAHRPCP